MVVEEWGYTVSSGELKWKKCGFECDFGGDGKRDKIEDELLVRW